MVNKILPVFLFVLFMSLGAFGQNGLSQELFSHGFENVKVYSSKDSLVIYFEHRTFRNPHQSMVLAKKVVGNREVKRLYFIPLYHNQPIGKYDGKGFSFADMSESDLDFYREKNTIRNGYRFHLRISPDFSARFGKFDDPFQNKTNLVLDSRIYLLPGLSLHSGILFPINNNLDAQENNIRLAPSHIHFFRPKGSKHFYSISGGLFFFDRYGLDVQYRFMPMLKNWSFGFEGSITGFYFLPKTGVYLNKLDDVTFLLNYEYRIPVLPSISLGITGGQFLFKDKGVRLDFIKQYGNIDFGFFGAVTQSGRNFGFQFAFPLFPGKILRNRNFELRTTEEFRWEYGYNNENVVARKFRLGTPRLQDVLRQYHPNFVKTLYPND